MKSLIIVLILNLIFLISHAKQVNIRDKYTIYDPSLHPFFANTPRDVTESVSESWIEQRLDHFNPQNERTFLMRYLTNTEFLQEGSPIFIFLGGEWTIFPGHITSGHVHDMARDLNAVLFYTEHRYYGFTLPTEDTRTENLRYLNADQALADIAHFIEFKKNEMTELRNSKVILIGVSYTAILATWFMQKYPHLANGAWASSGPIQATMDFKEYLEIAESAITRFGGDPCAARIERAFEQLQNLVSTGNYTKITEIFNLCSALDLNKERDLWLLADDLMGTWLFLVQSASRYNRFIENGCESFLAVEANSDIEAYAIWFKNMAGMGPDDCYDNNWETFFSILSNPTWRPGFIWRQWFHQTCAEIALFVTGNAGSTIFGSLTTLDLPLTRCLELFGGIFTKQIVQENIDRTNLIYGGIYPNVRNVYTTHGEYDPWRPMGVQVDINEDSPTVILPGESHMADLDSISERDTPEMKASKERIFSLIQQWIS